MVIALREYADDWQECLSTSPNHCNNWGVVQRVNPSSDARLRQWLSGVDQDASESEFWACVNDGAKPDRGTLDPPREALPADLVWLLINRVGLPETEVAELTKQEAIDRLNQQWATRDQP
jgi:hypothetical protein